MNPRKISEFEAKYFSVRPSLTPKACLNDTEFFTDALARQSINENPEAAGNESNKAIIEEGKISDVTNPPPLTFQTQVAVFDKGSQKGCHMEN